MPILFQPPDPVAPGISSAYGAAQQWTADAGHIVRAYAEAAQAQRDLEARKTTGSTVLKV